MTTEFGVIIEKLDSLTEKVDQTRKMAEQNNRSLRGYNSTPGMVADVKDCKDKIAEIVKNREVCIINFSEISKTLHGEGSEKIGIVGEQVIIRRLNKWLIGIATTVLISTIVTLVKLWFFTP